MTKLTYFIKDWINKQYILKNVYYLFCHNFDYAQNIDPKTQHVQYILRTKGCNQFVTTGSPLHLHNYTLFFVRRVCVLGWRPAEQCVSGSAGGEGGSSAFSERSGGWDG